MQPIRLKFWGVRGSIPTPGKGTLHYGGNTSCVELNFPGKPLFILDGGSGIRELGKELLKSPEPVKGYIFISHFHWDHIQGLPFFKPAFKPGNHFTFFGCDEPHLQLKDLFSLQMKPSFFPLAIEDMLATIEFKPILQTELEVEGVVIKTIFLNHPGYALGYRFEFAGKSLVYISDNEPFVENHSPITAEQQATDSIEDRFESYVENKEENLVSFLKDCDLLIHDTQFLPEEYQEKITWGHSPYHYTVDLAVKSGAKKLVLFHHDPDHDDRTIELILELSRRRLEEKGCNIPCIAAREGETLEI